MFVPVIQSPGFAKDESGAATPLVILFFLIFVVIGGLAVDYSKAVNERTQMQIATETAAHAGLYSWVRDGADVDQARTIALTMTGGMLPDNAFANALLEGDIQFGFWDPATETFTEDNTFVEDKDSPLASAVQVFAELEPSRDNESRSIFLSLIGQDTFTIRADTVYAAYYPPCLSEGFVAEGVVDMQSNNSFTDGFCIHSNTYVSLNQNNFFEPGTVVSMPVLSDLDIPASGFKRNDGLEAALRQGTYDLRILNEIPAMFASMRSGSPAFVSPAGVNSVAEVLWPVKAGGNGGGGDSGGGGNTKKGNNKKKNNTNTTDTDTTPTDPVVHRYSALDTGKKTLTPDAFDTKNRIYQLECSGNGSITLSAGTFSDFALVTNCDIKTSNGTVLDGVVLATEGDVSASHLQIGLDDGCTPGGGASIYSYGNFRAASGLQGYGAQMVFLGNIDFAAQAEGIEGASFIAGGTIDGTSNSSMGFCDGDGNDDFNELTYFRMVR